MEEAGSARISEKGGIKPLAPGERIALWRQMQQAAWRERNHRQRKFARRRTYGEADESK